MNHLLRAFLLAVVSLLAMACRGQTSAQAPIMLERNMYQQDRVNAQAKSRFFEDGRAMRKPVEHTFAREMNPSSEISDGEIADGSGYVLAIPDSVVSDLGGMAQAVDRGHQRYDIYCRPCHDGTGTGKGEVVKRGMLPPPSFHDDRVRHMPDGQLYATIGRGVRNMPAYKYSIPVNDRWAIVSYVRALQLSQAGEQ